MVSLISSSHSNPEPSTAKTDNIVPLSYVIRGNVSLSNVVNETYLRMVYPDIMKDDVSSYDVLYHNVTRWNPRYFGYCILTGNDTFPCVQFGGVHNKYYEGVYANENLTQPFYLTKVSNLNQTSLVTLQNQTFLTWNNGTTTTIEDLKCPICGSYMHALEPEFYNLLIFWFCLEGECRVIVAEQLQVINQP
jgi:hypothetical protein